SILVRFGQTNSDWRGDRRNIEDARFRIECSAPPVCSASPSRQIDGVLLARRSEDRAVVELIQQLDGFLAKLGSEVNQVVIRRSLELVRRGLCWKRLCRRRTLPERID